MKNLRQFCAAIVFTLALTFSALAGDINAPGLTTQPPPPPQPSATGDTARSDAARLDPLTEITLRMLQSMLSYF